jgi:CheY-like chemotaxis protein
LPPKRSVGCTSGLIGGDVEGKPGNSGGPDLDLLITDLQLPGMSGLELIRRGTSRDPSLRVLRVSMYEEAIYGERPEGRRAWIRAEERRRCLGRGGGPGRLTLTYVVTQAETPAGGDLLSPEHLLLTRFQDSVSGGV